jgi:hypothetical protein
MAKLEWSDPRPRINDFRHTWKSDARRSGMEEEVRAKFMGIAGCEKDVAQRFGFLDDSELIRAIDRFTYDNGLSEIVAVSRAGK